ncbi:outer membrane protein TolC [Deinobacterium chartae]|uniref:Outer membrane protein TolC n=1 Tax=Deinobacterium chartae TaxID=521158 RepID=A0A841HXF4_9DEIO|nr:TolC family protein [Deinobacterium chartae]MBB6097533.1 outer membrane protein TolC [Deinobacterium chartae]
MRRALGIGLLLTLSGTPGLAQQPPAPTPPAETAPPIPPRPPEQPPAQPTQPPLAPPVSPLLAAQGPSLTLEAALALLPQSPGWRAAELSYQAAQRSLEAARAAVGLSLEAGGDGNTSLNFGNGNTSLSASASATLSTALLPWAPVHDTVRSAERALQRAALDRRDARNTLALSVYTQYYAARAAARNLEAARQRAALAARQLEVAQAQRALGAASAETVLDRQRTLEEAQAQLSAAQGSLDLGLRTLSNTLGIQPAAYQLTSAPSAAALPSAALDELVQAAHSRRSEVLKAASNLEDARAKLAAAEKDRALPEFSLTAQAGQIGSGSGNSGAVVSGSLNFKSGTGSLSASAPLFSTSSSGSTGSGSNSGGGLALGLSARIHLLDPAGDAAIASARTATASSELALATARQSVELDVRQRYQEALNAAAQLPALNTALARARQALATAQARFEAGLSTALDVETARLDVLSAESALEAAQASALEADLRLQTALGIFEVQTGAPR